MKKILYISFALVFLILAVGVPVAVAHGHVYIRGGIWIGGPGWWGPWYPYPYPYYEPPVIVQQQPPVYVPQQQEELPYYWYYCPGAKAYYPYVKQCPDGWLKVVPPPQPESKP